MLEYLLVKTQEEYSKAKELFTEYAADINIDLSFQKFDNELLQIEKMYGAPEGGIILCKDDAQFIGCIAIRKFEEKICELKRMYVNPEFRGKGIGKQLLEKILELAKNYNYLLIRLDTLNYMTPAINLYKEKGFYEVKPYYHNPNATAVFFERILK